MSVDEHLTLDGTVDRHGSPAIRATTGGWFAGILLLGNQGLAALALYGVNVNLVLFMTRVMGKDNADAASQVTNWFGTVHICSLLGAFLGDSCWGRYKTCIVFQLILVMGLVLLSLSSYLFLVKPDGCGDEDTPCRPHSALENALLYISIYLVALGSGGYQPVMATFGADQFDQEHPKESRSKIAFFSYFYVALNLGCLISNTILAYFQNKGMWTLGFSSSAASAILALLVFLIGTPRYRHFVGKENPYSRIFQVIVAATRKWRVQVPSNGRRFKFLDKAALKTHKDDDSPNPNPWRLCSAAQVAEVKSILRLLPIWLPSIFYFVIFSQMISLLIEQGAAMSTAVSAAFHVPPASMSAFAIISSAGFVGVHRRIIDPAVSRLRPNSSCLTALERMGIALVIVMLSMVCAAVVEHFRLIQAAEVNSSRLSILWQVPQYALFGSSEVYMMAAQLEFFNGEAPEGLRSFGSALSMTSFALGSYASSLIVTVVTRITTAGGKAGWIPRNLNEGHLDWFFYLLAALTAADLAAYVVCAKWYRYAECCEPLRKENTREGA